MKNKKRNPFVIIAVCIALGLAVIVLINTVIKPTPIVVAKASISAGTTISEELVEVRTIPAGGVPADAYATIDDVVGKTVVVARAAGDTITVGVLGDTATAGLPSELAAGHVAIAIDVDKASAVAGLLRSGQTVTLIGMLTPDILTQQSGLASAYAQTIVTSDGSAPIIEGYSSQKTPTPAPVLGPLGRVTITGVKVLMVPKTFQYQEVADTTNQQEMLANSQATQEKESTIVLDVPTTPVEITPGVFVNPATLIATLNEYGKLYVALESSTGTSVTPANNLTINLAELYNLINATSAESVK